MDQSDLHHLTVSAGATQDELWLFGQPPLQKLLDYVEDLDTADTKHARAPLVAQWRAANDYYAQLETQEGGIADAIECHALGEDLMPLAAAVQADPRYRRTFDTLPTRIAMVELDRLVVCQHHVTRDFVDALKRKLGPAPDPVRVFHTCLPLDRQQSRVQIRKTGSRRYQFRCDSTDFRFHESALFRSAQVHDYEAYGDIAGIVGLVVGFSSNFLNAVEDDDSRRLVLNNGYHRACALRELGVTHVPCIIQTVGGRDELDLIAKSIVAESPGYFFNAPRPPLLKDFWDPRIARALRVARLARTIDVSFDVRESLNPY